MNAPANGQMKVWAQQSFSSKYRLPGDHVISNGLQPIHGWHRAETPFIVQWARFQLAPNAAAQWGAALSSDP